MLKRESQLHNRDLYLNRLIAFRDTEPVKIITGIRRCGKSSLMKLMAQYLRNDGVENRQIIEANFESMEFRNMDVQTFYEWVRCGCRRTNALTCSLMKSSAWKTGMMPSIPSV